MNKVNLLDIIFLGWYQIMDKTVYSFENKGRAIGPKEHSLFITFLLHGINLWTLLSYLLTQYFNKPLPLYFGLFVAILVFLLGYNIYIRQNRAEKVISYNITTIKILFYILASIIYTIISIYCMLEVGDFVRSKLTGTSLD